ncbi:prepilin-type N-terminal cleavage/methylation domain-containing protein [Candidatus Peribacteria bacterium]|jgi:prepilin-type N-terminal cleavage/methylation domain-containing protein|nr:prepilin-type N-terminal cleavage/methylation domain-containing protein [Candidatus Peribacteria bacterium]MBT4021714.1 prepilin-type N-terminal cleavage/methylation domain-containing protein [Candidatus Peribacteria bacterium]MBT4241177.1 prepilin-type N-terminal cleavage/methylation domain-containing protein [Candidatus Peribacteria bacterium]MBT4473930.1 prepilin-type N-terminal cleavage/methylation domain-containing protein [Candidatus Peribacteria bacterium]
MNKSYKGFTLIELLLVIGIIAILAAIVIVAINPTKQLGDARDAQRRSDVNTILNAVWQFAIDNNGSMPCDPAGDDCVDGNWRQLGAATTECDDLENNCSGYTVEDDCLELRALSGTYLVNIPADPRYATGSTGLAASSETSYVIRSVSNRVTVEACNPEQDSEVAVTR